MADDDGILHLVSQGDWLNSIARLYGVGDPDRIWNHPENAELAQRRDRDILYPGDWLYIPAPETKLEDCATEQRHKFKVAKVYDRFEVTLQDPNGQPYKNTSYKLTLDNQDYTGKTDGNGTVKVEKLVLSAGASGSLELPDLCLRYPVRMGFLNPVAATKPGDDQSNYDNGLSGALMRLRNLGYYHGPVPNSRGESAIDISENGDPIARFQTHKMGREPEQADGQLDDETRSALDNEALA